MGWGETLAATSIFRMIICLAQSHFETASHDVGAGVLARATFVVFVSNMKRIYEYRRHLPHYQSDNKGIFVTFCMHHAGSCPRKLA